MDKFVFLIGTASLLHSLLFANDVVDFFNTNWKKTEREIANITAGLESKALHKDAFDNHSYVKFIISNYLPYSAPMSQSQAQKENVKKAVDFYLGAIGSMDNLKLLVKESLDDIEKDFLKKSQDDANNIMSEAALKGEQSLAERQNRSNKLVYAVHDFIHFFQNLKVSLETLLGFYELNKKIQLLPKKETLQLF